MKIISISTTPIVCFQTQPRSVLTEEQRKRGIRQTIYLPMITTNTTTRPVINLLKLRMESCPATGLRGEVKNALLFAIQNMISIKGDILFEEKKSFPAYRILNDFRFYFPGFPALLHIYVTGIEWIGM